MQAGEEKIPAWCNYKNSGTYGKKYGKLYNWFAVNDPRGSAPKGWHIPSDVEWEELVKQLGGANVASERIKSKSGWGENDNGKDDVGFGGLPGGKRSVNGIFSDEGDYGYWWSSTMHSQGNDHNRFLSHNYGNLASFDNYKNVGLSVRCIKDSEF